jgi:hypothetical protein
MLPSRFVPLFVTAIVVALTACGPNAGGAAGGQTGGSPGSGGGAGGQTGSGGSPGSGGGSGGAVIDAPVDVADDSGGSSDTSGAKTMTDAAMDRKNGGRTDFCAGYSGPIPGVSSETFCAKYGSVCKFGGPGGYANMAGCLAQYGGAIPAIQGCRAKNLCDAAYIYLQPNLTVEYVQMVCSLALTSAACQ